MGTSKDNYFDQVNIEIKDNVMKYQNEAIQISNISQIRVSKEPSKPYPIGFIIALFVCMIGIFMAPIIFLVWIIGIIIMGLKLGSIAYYNLNLKTYLIIETNSGRISLFSARDERFLVNAKNSLIESFNNKNCKMRIDFSNCIINGSSFGDNSYINNQQ